MAGTKIPIRWTSPEALKFSKFSKKSDVWSFGVLLWEIITYGYTPYPGISNREVMEKVESGYRMSCPANCPEELYSIMKDCWKDQPEQWPMFIVLEEQLELVGTEESSKHEIDQDDVQLVKKLGAGQYSEVWEAHWKENPSVVVKMLRIGSMPAQEFLQEAHLLRKLQHENVIQVHATCTAVDSVFFVTEFMKHGNLIEYLSSDGKDTNISQLVVLVLEVAMGMAYLEKQGIIHQNLAARNVMVGENLKCKLADFGLAVYAHTVEELCTNRKFSIRWTAPEAAMYYKFSTKSDVWSFGMLLWETITYGRFPYPDMSNEEVLPSLEKGYHLPCPANCPDYLYSIMKDCWSKDTDKRPTFQVLETQFDDLVKNPKKEMEWKINKGEIKFIKKLGNGQHSEVWKGLWKGNIPVAVKSLKRGTLSACHFLEEATLLRKLQHTNIIQVYGVSSDDKIPYIVTELMIKRSLMECLRNEGKKLKYTQLINMSLQVAMGMTYLEEHNIIHQTLAARSILVGENLVCKVSNFRFAKEGDEGQYETLDRNKLFMKWTAPEAAVYNRFTTKSDVWSFGIVLFEIITHGQTPYPRMTFAETQNHRTCECVCDPHIQPYVECILETESLQKSINAWLVYINYTDPPGYLVHVYCPFDYCIPPNISTPVNLNKESGADAQCALNRRGLLCGTCMPGLSLSLGSSKCLKCPKFWPALFLFVTILAFLSGMTLVVLCLLLNMTVAVGTLNGLLFYANIVAANRAVLLPYPQPKFITVFISLLNLELGIDVCYINGMDTYTKTWLQLAFPIYIIFLVILLIIISNYSSKFSRLIGKKNPITTLATLILLSYGNLMHVVLLAQPFSFAALSYPDGTSKLVWLPDGTLDYATGKHIALLIIAFLILIACLAYSLLLLCWQLILYCPNRRILRLARNPKLYLFMEAYHIPYIPKHRYWTGLLLLARAILYLIAAANVSGNPHIQLTAIMFVLSCIIFLKMLTGSKIFKERFIDAIDSFFYFNTLLFAFFTSYNLSTGGNQDPIAYTSVTLSFLVLLLIIFYHIYTFTTLLSKIQNNVSVKNIIKRFKVKSEEEIGHPPSCGNNDRFDGILDIIDSPISDIAKPNSCNIPQEPTTSVVELS